MTDISVVGGSYELTTRGGAAQRTINMYPVKLVMENQYPPEQEGREKWALRRTPGLSLIGTLPGTNPIRGLFSNDNDWYALSGSNLYHIVYNAITGSFASTQVATLDNVNTPVRWARNLGNQITIVDAFNTYVYNYNTGTTTVLTDGSIPTFGGAVDVQMIDGYMVVANPQSQIFQLSNSNDALTWTSQYIVQTSGNPNNIVGFIVINRQLWVIGTQNTEIWYFAGQTTINGVTNLFPMQPVSGVFLNVGCVGVNTICQSDGSGFWLDGRGFVYMCSAEAPQVISTEAISELFSTFNDLNTAYAYMHAVSGHLFYVLTFPNENRTFCYDIVTQYWHERNTRSATSGQFVQHLGFTSVRHQQFYFIGDNTTSNIYVYKPGLFTDNGLPIQCLRRTKFFSDENKQIGISKLCLELEGGVGINTGQGLNPQIMMRYSHTGAHTWSNESWRTLGAQGVYTPYVVWQRLGTSREWCFEFTVSDPVDFAIYGASIQINGDA